MKLLLSVLASVAMVSCSHLATPFPDGRGGVAYDTIVGGDGMRTINADGSTGFTYKQTKSLQHVVQGVTAIASAWFSALVELEKELTAQLANANLSTIERARIAAQLAEVKATIAAGVSGATVVNPNIPLPLRR